MSKTKNWAEILQDLDTYYANQENDNVPDVGDQWDDDDEEPDDDFDPHEERQYFPLEKMSTYGVYRTIGQLMYEDDDIYTRYEVNKLPPNKGSKWLIHFWTLGCLPSPQLKEMLGLEVFAEEYQGTVLAPTWYLITKLPVPWSWVDARGNINLPHMNNQ